MDQKKLELFEKLFASWEASAEIIESKGGDTESAKAFRICAELGSLVLNGEIEEIHFGEDVEAIVSASKQTVH